MTKGMRIYKEREKTLLEECLKQEERGELSHEDAMSRYYMARDEILDAIPYEWFTEKEPVETATYKFIPISERHPSDCCWFCRTDKSVKYRGKFINPNPTAKNRYIHILMCNKCALNHSQDLIEEESK